MDMQEIHDSLTKEEERAIASLGRLAKKWPQSLWLFSQNGSLHVMKKNAEGEMAVDLSGALDLNYHVGAVLNIDTDSGD
jgi:hypothetical protein